MRFLLFLLLLVKLTFLGAQELPPFLTDYDKVWVDKTFKSMTLDHKIGQLLMPRGNFSGKSYDVIQLEEWVTKYKIGGIVFFAGNPTEQALITNKLQSISDFPLFIGEDFEWGLAMRMDSTVRFPYAIAIGASQGKDEIVKQMGVEIARQCKRLGVHINYAPVVDVNINPNNPVINFRSFGENKINVANKAVALMQGMQSERIISTAKHFPGHGDTDIDSHYDLPIIKHDLKRLHDIELYPFKKMIHAGLTGVMSAHLHIPALDNEPNISSTLSKKTLTDLLKVDLGYEGLVFTDAMDMKAIVKHFPKGESIVRALIAGNDIIETFTDVPGAIEAIKEAIKSGKISEDMINKKVIKILKAKSWVGLNKYKPVEIENLIADLNNSQSDFLNQALTEGSITLIKNENNLLPIQDLTQKIALICIEPSLENPLAKMALNYANITVLNLNKESLAKESIEGLQQILNYFDVVLVSVHLPKIRPTQKYGLTDEIIQAVNILGQHKNSVLIWLGNPYGLSSLQNTNQFKSIVMGYQENEFVQNAIPQAIFGAIPFEGKLPISINDSYKSETGIVTKAIERLAYGVGEHVGINSEILSNKIDSMMSVALDNKYFPGAVVQISIKNRVVFQKAYGSHFYENDFKKSLQTQIENFEKPRIDDAMDDSTSGQEINDSKSRNDIFLSNNQMKVDDVFDLASVTKVTATALAMMQWISNDKINLSDSLGKYFTKAIGTDKSKLMFKDLLTHEAGLQSWIPFWATAIDSTKTLKKAIFFDPALALECSVRQKKRNFFQKIFRKTPKYEVDTLATISQNKSDLWKKIIKYNTITWKEDIFNASETKEFSVYIADSLWMNRMYQEEIIKKILNSPLNPKPGYLYSDLHFYFYPMICQKIMGESWEDFLQKSYNKIGANTLGYLPSERYQLDKIVPTEYDSLFRKNLIHGFVHDEGAIMMGGISGHAGLFGNANDVSKLMQMYLNKGSYGGNRFILPEVMDKCTSYQYPEGNNRRGIIFDKKDFNPSVYNAPKLSSSLSYGHSGFTGTYVWVDPKYDLNFVFLSNRVYPSRENRALITSDFRQKLADEVYKLILNK